MPSSWEERDKTMTTGDPQSGESNSSGDEVDKGREWLSNMASRMRGLKANLNRCHSPWQDHSVGSPYGAVPVGEDSKRKGPGESTIRTEWEEAWIGPQRMSGKGIMGFRHMEKMVSSAENLKSGQKPQGPIQWNQKENIREYIGRYSES